MARIAGTTIPNDKRIVISLTYIYGIGRTTAEKILKEAGIDESKRAKDLTDQEVITIRNIVDGNYNVEGELRREVLQNIKRLKEIGSYRGLRHTKRLPARGQRSKTNSRTVRGNVRKTAGSGKVKLAKT